MSHSRNSNLARALLVAMVAAIVFWFDQLTKSWIMRSFLPGESRIVIPHLLNWTYERNFHGAFGFFGSNSLLLIGMALVVLLVFFFSFKDAAAQSWVVCVAFGLIVGGAIGNVADRVHHGYVVDFVDFYKIWPNIFNFADSCITGGVILLLLKSFAARRRA